MNSQGSGLVDPQIPGNPLPWLPALLPLPGPAQPWCFTTQMAGREGECGSCRFICNWIIQRRVS